MENNLPPKTAPHVKKRMRKYHAGSVLLVIIGFMLIGVSYRAIKMRNEDRKMELNVAAIGGEVEWYMKRTGSLPISLVEAEVSNPEQNIAYTKIDANKYQLCTTFKLKNQVTNYVEKEPVSIIAGNHGKGYYCFVVRPNKPIIPKKQS